MSMCNFLSSFHAFNILFVYSVVTLLVREEHGQLRKLFCMVSFKNGQSFLNPDPRQAFNPAHGTVASRIQAFQDGQGSRSPKSAVRVWSPIPGAEIEVQIGRVKRANTTFATPACLPRIEMKEDGQHAVDPEGDTTRHESVIESVSGEDDLDVGLPARPATSYESTIPLLQHKLHSFSRQSPDRHRTQKRRQSSINAQSTTQIQLSEARARLRSIDDRRTGDSIVPQKCVNVSPVRQDVDIHQLQGLIDHALDEQSELDIEGRSAKRSPRLKSITSQVELSMNSPPKRQSPKWSSNGSPLRRDRNGRSFSRPRESVPAPKGLVGKYDDHLPYGSNSQASPTRKQRLSTETVLPRSSTESEPLTTSSYPPVYSFREMNLGRESSLPKPTIPTRQAPSPVKQRTAAFEKMMQRDKQIMYDQPHQHIAGARLKKHWWLEPDENRVNRMPGILKQEANATTSKVNGIIPRDPPDSSRTTTPIPRSGPIPLALPQLISSRGRTVSAASQFEDSFETAPQSEAALSRLSSRVHSSRTILKASGAQEVGKGTKSPFLKWKAFMLDRKLPVYKTVPLSPGKSNIGANAESDVTEQTTDTASCLQFRGNDLALTASQDAISQPEYGQRTVSTVMQSRGMSSAATSHETPESYPPQDLSPQRLQPRKPISPKQDLTFRDVTVPGELVRQADGAGVHREVTQTKPRCSSDDMAIDDEKELLVAPNTACMDEHVDIANETSDETAWRGQTTDLTPFPLVQVEDILSASASASAPGSPIRGRVASRTLHRQSTLVRNDEGGNGVRVKMSRSRSKVGNVKVTVEVRTPQGSPGKGNAQRDSVGDGNAKGERVVIVTTDVQGHEEDSVEG